MTTARRGAFDVADDRRSELARLLDDEFQGDWTGERVVCVLEANPELVLSALGGIYNGKSTDPLHWWRFPVEGTF